MEKVCKDFTVNELWKHSFLRVLLNLDILSRDVRTEELHILKMVCLLITYEEDWTLLQRHMNQIVAFLSNEEVCSSISDKRRNTSKSITTDELIIVINVDVGSVTSSNYAISNSGSFEEKRRFQYINARNNQVFFAGAVAKMSLLFSCINRESSILISEQMDISLKLFKTIKVIYASQRNLPLLDEENPRNPESSQLKNILDVIPLLCSSALSDIAEVSAGRTEILRGGAFELVVDWFSSCERVIDLVLLLTSSNISLNGIYNTVIEHQFTLVHNFLVQNSSSLKYLSSSSDVQLILQSLSLSNLIIVKSTLLKCIHLTEMQIHFTSLLPRLCADTSSFRDSVVSNICSSFYSVCRSLQGYRAFQLEKGVENINEIYAGIISVESFENQVVNAELVHSVLLFSFHTENKLSILRFLAALSDLRDSFSSFTGSEMQMMQVIDSVCTSYESFLESSPENEPSQVTR